MLILNNHGALASGRHKELGATDIISAPKAMSAALKYLSGTTLAKLTWLISWQVSVQQSQPLSFNAGEENLLDFSIADSK
jgi:hypothetical protein